MYCNYTLTNGVFITHLAYLMRCINGIFASLCVDKFKLFASDNLTECETTFLHDSGTVTSPHYPHNYPNNHQSCVAEIKVPSGSVLHLRFVVFDVEPSDECDFDCVRVSQAMKFPT